ncbi:MAG: hypothetical protein P1V36_02025 [Planctomycetota bacterium]|nr:hypothetical protein [Planctomycetota bacterium]
MTRWIDDAAVRHAQETVDPGALLAAGVPHAMSPDGRYVVLVRDHAAWHIEGEGWRDSNSPPEAGAEGRPVLNFSELPVGDDAGLWFKTLLPASVAQLEFAAVDAEHCLLGTASGTHPLSYRRFGEVMLHVATGNAQSEADLERAFERVGDPPGDEGAFGRALGAVLLLLAVLLVLPPVLAHVAGAWVGVGAAALAAPAWLRLGPKPMPGFLAGLLAVSGMVAILAMLAALLVRAIAG